MAGGKRGWDEGEKPAGFEGEKRRKVE